MCDDNRIIGHFYGVGLGPGDPDLLTVKAVQILKESDCIIVPKARYKAESVARDIVTRALGEDLPFEEMVFPMSRDKEELERHWNSAAKRVVAHLEEGKNVAFVSLGDISLYSTYSYLKRAISEIAPQVESLLVPGISSIQLAAAAFQVPLALGDENCVIQPLPADLNDLDDVFQYNDNVVLMKIGSRLGDLKEYLQQKDLTDKAGFIRRAGFPDQFLSKDLSTISDEETGYLSIVFVKKGGLS